MKLVQKTIEIDITNMTVNNIGMLKFHLNKMGINFKEEKWYE